jgi:hypothetical protein
MICNMLGVLHALLRAKNTLRAQPSLCVCHISEWLLNLHESWSVFHGVLNLHVCVFVDKGVPKLQGLA